MRALVLVFVGAGMGGVARYLVGVACQRAFGPSLPWGTLAVNVAGSLAMGLLAGWLLTRAGEPGAADLRLFLATGVLGGFTTFSAFSLDAVALWERGAAGLALGYVAGSVLVSIAALVLGLWLMRLAA
jgi:CrcB protein